MKEKIAQAIADYWAKLRGYREPPDEVDLSVAGWIVHRIPELTPQHLYRPDEVDDHGDHVTFCGAPYEARNFETMEESRAVPICTRCYGAATNFRVAQLKELETKLKELEAKHKALSKWRTQGIL